MILKLTRRSIRSFFGRYMALLLIVALSAGFFAGLKITKDAMLHTGERYLQEQCFYDFRLFSTLGFTADDVESLHELSAVAEAEGNKSVDVLAESEGDAVPFKLLSLPEKVNLPSLDAGRMPETANECLADAKVFGEEQIGTVIRITGENENATLEALCETELEIVGIAHSPLYIGLDRGTTGIGSGSLRGFLYVPEACFTSEVYTEINLTLQEGEALYSDAYDDLIAEKKDEIADRTAKRAAERYRALLAESGLTPETAALLGISEPQTYVLTRTENAGYVNFESDTSIVSGIANIFPLFFILVALLVCMTTMTRMVDEERTQNGVLKSMGFSDFAVASKYLLYAGSATVLGWAVGFFLGTWGLPKVFWMAYHALYSFAPIRFLFSPFWAAVTLLVSLAGILGCTWLSCRKEMRSEPARLIRPRTAKSGKRILLERIPFLWKRLRFLQKITLRNLFRYKRRMIMMIIGIGCCAGLVVTAFGVGDSMLHVGELHFGSVQKYEFEVGLSEGDETEVAAEIEKMDEIKEPLSCSVHRVDLECEDRQTTVRLLSFQSADRLAEYWDFHTGEEGLAFPGKGEALISLRAAENLSISVGDVMKVQNADRETFSVTVSGIFDCYIDNFAVISADTYEEALGEWSANTLLLALDHEEDNTAEKLTALDGVTGVVRLSNTKDAVESALASLKYIIGIVVLFSGALAFIVIFNLTNINLAERSREIATVRVLGFTPRETESYVLRENLVLSVLAGFIGLPIGTLFHAAVMRMIVIDFLAYPIQIKPLSYVLALICTDFFALVVNLLMKRQIGKVNMAESLKAVE